MKSHLTRSLVVIVAVVCVCLIFPSVAEACPTCKEGLNDGNHHGIQRGYFWSIVFMMSMPFVILSGLSLMFYLSIRRATRDGEFSNASLAMPTDA